jgi:pimeloyl-ACP methyl ester carboxylesterase
LSEIVAPTVVIAGAEDPSAPPQDAQLIASHIRGATFHVVEGAAHLANVERPAEFNRLLEEHL